MRESPNDSALAARELIAILGPVSKDATARELAEAAGLQLVGALRSGRAALLYGDRFIVVDERVDPVTLDEAIARELGLFALRRAGVSLCEARAKEVVRRVRARLRASVRLVPALAWRADPRRTAGGKA